MTPELQQAIGLLQLSSLELCDLIQKELLDNPVLELDDGEEGEKKGDEPGETVHEKDAIDWEQYLQEVGVEPSPGFSQRQTDEGVPFDHYLSKEPSLQERLLRQVGLCRMAEADKRMAEFLIGNIDQNGYLQGELEEFALLLGVELREIESALAVIQQFDPVGVGARNLRECLLLQLRERGDVHPLAQKIIELYLADVAENRFKKIARELQVEIGQVQVAVDFIRTLDPKPGRFLGDNRDVRYIVPDVFVEEVDGEYVILVNEFSAPRLTINPYYRSLLAKETGASLTGSFIKGRLDSALWLLRSIEQRRRTLYKVTEAIVRRQRCFFDEGIRFLKPLVLRQIAEEVGVHESTVSRATANKHAQTPRGLYPLKFFFASGVEGSQGIVSAESVKSHLREVIAAENIYSPLSDQQLAELLMRRGITVSRRTIAKYREELTIPSSSRRKRH